MGDLNGKRLAASPLGKSHPIIVGNDFERYSCLDEQYPTEECTALICFLDFWPTLRQIEECLSRIESGRELERNCSEMRD